MRESDRAVDHLDHVIVEGRTERVAVQLRGLDPAMRARKQQRRLGVSRQPVEPILHEHLQRRRNRQRLRRIDNLVQRTRKLQREERVAAGALVKAEQRGPREHPPEPSQQKTVQRAQAQRADGEMLDDAPVHSKLERGHPDVVLEPAGAEKPDVAVVQTPQRESKRAHGRRIQPLHVVDRNQDRLAISEQMQRAPDGHSESSRINTAFSRPLDEQSALERATTRRGQCRRNLRERVLEEVSQPRVREPQLGLCRPRREHAKTPRTRRRDTLTPKRRLPDPRFAIQHERWDLSSRRSIEKSMQRTKLLIPAHDSHDWTNLLADIVSRPAAEAAGVTTIQSLARSLNSRKPKRRLANPRLTHQHERRHVVSRRSIEENMERKKLLIPAQHIHDWTTSSPSIVSRPATKNPRGHNPQSSSRSAPRQRQALVEQRRYGQWTMCRSSTRTCGTHRRCRPLDGRRRRGRVTRLRGIRLVDEAARLGPVFGNVP